MTIQYPPMVNGIEAARVVGGWTAPRAGGDASIVILHHHDGTAPVSELTSFGLRVSHVLALKRRAQRMAIDNRNLEVGTRLVGRYKGKTTVCLVEASEEGSTSYRLEGKDKTFKSLSSAATEITKGPINGWKFWSLEGDEPASPETGTKTPAMTAGDKKEGKTTRRTRQRPTYRVIHLHENQEDLTEGEVRWLCDACIKPFIMPAGEEPTECPNGHRIDDPDLNTGAAAVEGEAE